MVHTHMSLQRPCIFTLTSSLHGTFHSDMVHSQRQTKQRYSTAACLFDHKNDPVLCIQIHQLPNLYSMIRPSPHLAEKNKLISRSHEIPTRWFPKAVPSLQDQDHQANQNASAYLAKLSAACRYMYKIFRQDPVSLVASGSSLDSSRYVVKTGFAAGSLPTCPSDPCRLFSWASTRHTHTLSTRPCLA